MPTRVTEQGDSERALALERLAARINADIEVRTATSNDAVAYELLMNQTYRRKKPAGYYAWRFERCPEPSRLVVAVSNHAIVGCMGGHVRSLTDGRKVLFTVDLVVAPEYRNRGLHLLMEKALQEFSEEHGAVALVAFPNKDGLRAHLSVPGCRLVDHVQTLVLREDKRHVNPVEPSRPPRSLVRFSQQPSYPDWRYAQNPEYRYTRVVAGHNCWGIFKNFHDEVTQANYIDIVDYCNETRAELSSMITAVQSHPDAASRAQLCLWALPHTASYRAFDSLGFTQLGRQRALCVRPFCPTGQDLADPLRWDVRQVDCEIY